MVQKKIIVVDDEIGIQNLLKRVLKTEGYDVRVADNGFAAVEMAKEDIPDLVLCDIKMPVKDGIETLGDLKKIRESIEVIMITAHSTVENAVTAMKLGAADYLKKPFDVEELKIVIEKTLGIAAIKKENDVLREEIGLRYGIDQIIGQDAKMQEIFELIKTVASTKSTVLIHGESGTGKELIAGAIHNLSPRKNQRFVKVNCAAISEELLESELFGHEKGAFTGAIRTNEGKFVLADGGSILLDEISEMSPKLQAKLLRVLQEKEIDKVGGREPIKVDVRVMATTNRYLAEEVKKGNFREDLYYRLNVVTIAFPPLRERKGDILLLIKFFMDRYNREMNKKVNWIDKDVEQTFLKYHWPGNVRQLENCIERSIVLSKSNTITMDYLPMEIVQSAMQLQSGGDDPGIQAGMTVAEMEKQLIFKTLDFTNNNRTRAAELLGISIRTLRNKLHEYKGFIDEDDKTGTLD